MSFLAVRSKHAVVELSQRLVNGTRRVGDARERVEDAGAAGVFMKKEDVGPAGQRVFCYRLIYVATAINASLNVAFRSSFSLKNGSPQTVNSSSL